ncbi:MAG: CoA-binding protein [Balneolaceae bacterium]
MNTGKNPLFTDFKALFEQATTIAIIGCSSNRYRTSNQIAEYLQESGYRIIPVNPNETDVLGEKAYPSIQDLPRDYAVDIVAIFRNKRHTPDMLAEITEWSHQTGQKPVVWTQLDVSHPEAEEMAGNHQLPYVRNRCIMVEHRAST